MVKYAWRQVLSAARGFFCQVPSVYLQGYTKTVNQHFMKFGQDMEPVLRNKLIKTVVDLEVITFGRIFFLWVTLQIFNLSV